MNTYSNAPTQQTDHSVIKRTLFYVATITAVCLIVNLSIRFDYYILHGIPEISLTETLQSIALAFIITCFYKATKAQNIKAGSILVLGFFSVLLVREFDFWFDKIAHGFWFYPAMLITFLALFTFFKRGKNSFKEFVTLLTLPGMNRVIIGVVLLVIFSRIFGTGSFWRDVVSNDAFLVKTIIQEGLELLCYCLVSIGSFETYQQAKCLSEQQMEAK